MQDKKKDTRNPTYVMPKVSVIIQRGDTPQNKYTYTYSDYVAQNHRSVMSMVLSTAHSTFVFLFAVIMLAIPVSAASVLVINTMQSQGVVTIRTQEVPSDGNQKIYLDDKEVLLIKPAK